jgi:hypothetical protein
VSIKVDPIPSYSKCSMSEVGIISRNNVCSHDKKIMSESRVSIAQDV